MNSFYWTQALLVIGGAVLALFISFGPNRTAIAWLKYLGIAAAVALFIANQVVMSNTGDGLDKMLNCWINPAGVACPKHNVVPLPIPSADAQERAQAPALSAKALYDQALKALYDQALVAYRAKNFVNARALFKQACDGGDARGCNGLGFMWSEGEGGGVDEPLARALYKQACDGGNGLGCTNLLRIGS